MSARAGRPLDEILDRPSDEIWLLPQDFVVCLKQVSKHLLDEGSGTHLFNCSTIRYAGRATIRLARPPR